MVKMAGPVRTPSRIRARHLTITSAAILIFLTIVVWSMLTPFDMRSVYSRVPRFVNSDRDVRAGNLASELQAWGKGNNPSNAIAAAAVCTPRDAADAVFKTLSSAKDDIRNFGVIDVGANKGFPVTKLALQRRAKWVVAVEPDPRNYAHLKRLPRYGTVLEVVQGAASDAKGTAAMAFDDNRDDFTCFGCLNRSREGVREENVKIDTVDSLLIDGLAGAGVDGAQIALLKTDTQGHEDAVLRGAEKILKSGRVLFSIMEFDPKLLRTEERALTALQSFFDVNMQCLHLSLAPLTDEQKQPGKLPLFGEVVTPLTARRFYQFVKKIDKYTDVLCARRTPY